MSQRLTDTEVKKLAQPPSGAKIYYDADVKGFGCRVTAAGARSFVLNYRTKAGRERRFTIGAFPDWKVGAAREEASSLKKAIDRGEDPMGAVTAYREAPTVADLCNRFEKEYLPKRRPGTQRDYEVLLRREIRPDLGKLKVADVTFSDVDSLHRKITARGATYQANRTVAVLSKLFNLALRWKMRTDNPAKGIERNPETKRHRYLSPAELAALSVALEAHEDQQAANIVRLLLLTGARRGEVLAARWEQFDFASGVWTKPGATTKQKTDHRAPLSAPARQLLAGIKTAAERAAKDSDEEMSAWVFPANRGETGHRVDVKSAWGALCKAAGLTKAEEIKGPDGRPKTVMTHSARIHDLRHTYASVLASAGLSLPIIGALLGHTQPATTARYAHLLDDPLRQATERAGAIITGKPSAAVVKLRGAGDG